MPTLPDDLVKAIENTPGASIQPDGSIRLRVARYQAPEQAGRPALRGAVFYLPEAKSRYQRYYTTGREGYGGRQRVEGEVVIRNPIWAKGASGGRVPQLAYDQIRGKGAYQALRKDILENVIARLWWTKEDPAETVRRARSVLHKHGGHDELAEDIVRYSTQSNQLAYAVQENIVAAAAEDAGYDAILGYTVIKGEPRLSELLLLTSKRYPTVNLDLVVHPDPELPTSQQARRQVRRAGTSKKAPATLKGVHRGAV